ncbi:TIGR04283 family arsenosugar biosynthesis glycosyltransferase [Flavobacterium sp. K5-23]|uniref:TIGR04283 family arsenosugar biosynthesis glycosyltransferase n=1 Tax=Flavobacterium sp. K5-23 TaxID=2746225 RepID=UPI00200C8EFB|nr:TIGR04283 family arsenosugar biosynthesis glycosyltransferase [Flavobacterium sp. K5-23]UQD57343.1 TIGR04283 family arsenosugar biosynthesis glycosyltransferase [Flavobacterium sp. K5-23]
MNKISIIIPILNEVGVIHRLLLHLENSISKTIEYEIIVVDGGSTDGFQTEVQKHPKTAIVYANIGRAKQMNAGAQVATGNTLYFLHCDSFPPRDFDRFIDNEITKGNNAGCFRMKFDSQHPLLVISQWFTRINHISCRGGDQSLFISKEIFDEIGGYNENFTIYEDNEIISRLYAKNQFTVIPKTLITSARRYRQNGVTRLHYHFTMIHLKRRLGHSAESMLRYYKNNIT